MAPALVERWQVMSVPLSQGLLPSWDSLLLRTAASGSRGAEVQDIAEHRSHACNASTQDCLKRGEGEEGAAV